MKPEKILGKISKDYPLNYSPEIFSTAQEFVMEKWLERFNEKKIKWEKLGETYYDSPPEDLSYSCKFSSLFAAAIFGGEIKGNQNHQYCTLGQEIIDLNHNSKDVKNLENPYIHENSFFGNREHISSMKSCKERVKIWLNEFPYYLNQKNSKKKLKL